MLVGGHGEDTGAGVGEAKASEGVGGVLSFGSALEGVKRTESLDDQDRKASPCGSQSTDGSCRRNREYSRATAMEWARGSGRSWIFGRVPQGKKTSRAVLWYIRP